MSARIYAHPAASFRALHRVAADHGLRFCFERTRRRIRLQLVPR